MEIKRRPFHWMVFVNIPAALLVGLWVPVRIVFFGSFPDADAVVDGLFMAVVALRLWVHNTTFTERRNAKNIQLIHRSLSLLGELLVALPLVSVMTPAWGPSARYLFLFKFLFLRCVLDIRRVLDSTDKLHPAVVRLVPVTLVMPLVVHAIACGWVGLGSGTAGPHPDRLFEYGRAVYWAVTTLCTVGYGDIAGRTLPQMFYANAVMIVGVAFFGYVLTNVASLIARLDAVRDEYLTFLDKVEGFMRYNDLPAALRTRVRSYYRYLWESRRGYDDSSLMADLPSKLRMEINLHRHAEFIKKVPVLSDAAPELVQDIVGQLQPLVVVPGEKIFCAGEPGSAMYFIHRGAVQIISPDGLTLATLPPGAFFGEMALLTSNRRNATAQTVDYCELSVLSREAFDRVLHRHPAFEKHVWETVAQRTPPSPSAPL
jgi:hypothetical protein